MTTEAQTTVMGIKAGDWVVVEKAEPSLRDLYGGAVVLRCQYDRWHERDRGARARRRVKELAAALVAVLEASGDDYDAEQAADA